MTAAELPASGRGRPHVVVAGGGIAGVETLLALRELAGQRVTVELLTAGPELVMKPLGVAAPFGPAEVRRHPLEPICADLGVHLRIDRVESVDAEGRRVVTARGVAVAYDALVLALGARPRASLPGALTFEGQAGIDGFRTVLDEIRDGGVRSLGFVVPEGVTWSLPLYELALMTAEAVAGAGVALSFVTPEDDPLELFGEPARARVGSLLVERGVDLVTGAVARAVRGGTIRTDAGEVSAERVVALPVLDGPRVPGVPCDARGFIRVDEHGAVPGVPGVWAAGDGTVHPVKQGGLAAQQADAAAEAIASAAGAPCEPRPFRPQLRAQLFTGSLPWFLRGGREEAHTLATRAALWSPSGKLAARYLTPYLAERDAWRLGDRASLHDRQAPPDGGSEQEDEEERIAVRDLALVLADDEAGAGHAAAALHWLEVAEGAAGALPAEYARRRHRWAARAAQQGRAHS